MNVTASVKRAIDAWNTFARTFWLVASKPTAKVIDHAYRDAEGWILFDISGEPVDWPKSWPDEIDVVFLRAHGIRIAG